MAERLPFSHPAFREAYGDVRFLYDDPIQEGSPLVLANGLIPGTIAPRVAELVHAWTVGDLRRPQDGYNRPIRNFEHGLTVQDLISAGYYSHALDAFNHRSEMSPDHYEEDHPFMSGLPESLSDLLAQSKVLRATMGTYVESMLNVEDLLRNREKGQPIDETELERLREKYRESHEHIKTFHPATRLYNAAIAQAVVENLEQVRSPQEQRRIAREALKYHVRFLFSHGLEAAGLALQDLALKKLYPDQYLEVQRQLESIRPDLERQEKTWKTFLEQLLAEKGYHANVEFRPKTTHSVFEKIHIRQHSAHTYDLGDLGAFCVTLIGKGPKGQRRCTADDCRKVYGWVRDYARNELRVHDVDIKEDLLGENRKPNGYEALHAKVVPKPKIPLSVPMSALLYIPSDLPRQLHQRETRTEVPELEFHFRTLRMGLRNDSGTAGHAFYKGYNLETDQQEPVEDVVGITSLLPHATVRVTDHQARTEELTVPRKGNVIDALAAHSGVRELFQNRRFFVPVEVREGSEGKKFKVIDAEDRLRNVEGSLRIRLLGRSRLTDERIGQLAAAAILPATRDFLLGLLPSGTHAPLAAP